MLLNDMVLVFIVIFIRKEDQKDIRKLIYEENYEVSFIKGYFEYWLFFYVFVLRMNVDVIECD